MQLGCGHVHDASNSRPANPRRVLASTLTGKPAAPPGGFAHASNLLKPVTYKLTHQLSESETEDQYEHAAEANVE